MPFAVGRANARLPLYLPIDRILEIVTCGRVTPEREVPAHALGSAAGDAPPKLPDFKGLAQ